MRGKHWRVLVPTALILAVSPAAHGAFRLDFEPWSVAHEDARAIAKRGTIFETLEQKGILYAANISVGTPPQSQLVQLAVNSADTVILASNSTYCRAVYADNCTRSGSYNANDSSTYVHLDSNFSVSYPDGSSVAGDYITDTLTIGNGTLARQQLAVAYDTGRPYGILGLGFAAQEVQALQSGRQYSNVPESMADAGFINSNAYSLWLNDYEARTGSILFGGIDTEKFEGDLMTVPLLARPANSSDLLLPLSGVSIGDTQFLSGEPLTASLDAGNTYTQLPKAVAEELFAMTGASTVEGVGVATIPCDQQNNDTQLVFTISEWVNVSISLSNLVYNLNETFCLFGIAVLTDSVTQLDSKLEALLGLTFLMNAYVVYDLSNQEISLAPAKFNVTTSNILEIQNGFDGVPGAVRTASASTSGAAATDATPSSQSGGLSAGASAGIGVGAAAVAILLALGAFLFWRRRRKARKAGNNTGRQRPAELPGYELIKHDTIPSDKRRGEMEAEGNQLAEAPGTSARVEAPGDKPVELAADPPVELEGSEPFDQKKGLHP